MKTAEDVVEELLSGSEQDTRVMVIFQQNIGEKPIEFLLQISDAMVGKKGRRIDLAIRLLSMEVSLRLRDYLKRVTEANIGEITSQLKQIFSQPITVEWLQRVLKQQETDFIDKPLVLEVFNRLNW